MGRRFDRQPMRLSWLAVAMIVITMSAVATAEETPSSVATVPDLLKKLDDENDAAAGAAASELLKRGPSVGPALVGALHQRHGCQLQWIVAGILDELALEPQLVTATLMEMARGHCGGSAKTDRLLQRQAAIAIVPHVEAIPVLGTMLSDRDIYVRRSAAFAFDELTERLQGRPPAIEATSTMLDATRRALPLLLEAALHDTDEIVHCMSYESLDQARRSKHEALRADAVKLIEGKTFPCKR